MQNDQLQPACITIRYGEHRYLLCADEVTNFLINCQALGLSGPAEIGAALEKIVSMLPDSETPSIALLKEFQTSLRACIFNDV